MTDIIIPEKEIKNMIYEVRGKQVMLDSDLAKLYGYANGTKTFNQAVNRNIERFPERFRFKLTKEEYTEILRSQSGTLELEPGKYSKYLPYVFTEQGVSMLSSVLRTAKAAEVSINIMDAFVEMRKLIRDNSDMFKRMISVEYKLLEHDDKINQILDEMNPKELK